jgi:hypothetical protein
LRWRLACSFHSWLQHNPAMWTYAKSGVDTLVTTFMRRLPRVLNASQIGSLKLRTDLLARLGCVNQAAPTMYRRRLLQVLNEVRIADRLSDQAKLGLVCWTTIRKIQVEAEAGQLGSTSV